MSLTSEDALVLDSDEANAVVIESFDVAGQCTVTSPVEPLAAADSFRQLDGVLAFKTSSEVRKGHHTARRLPSKSVICTSSKVTIIGCSHGIPDLGVALRAGLAPDSASARSAVAHDSRLLRILHIPNARCPMPCTGEGAGAMFSEGSDAVSECAPLDAERP